MLFLWQSVTGLPLKVHLSNRFRGCPQVCAQSVGTVKYLLTLMLHVRRRVFHAPLNPLTSPLMGALRSSVGKSAQDLQDQQNQ